MKSTFRRERERGDSDRTERETTYFKLSPCLHLLSPQDKSKYANLLPLLSPSSPTLRATSLQSFQLACQQCLVLPRIFILVVFHFAKSTSHKQIWQKTYNLLQNKQGASCSIFKIGKSLTYQCGMSVWPLSSYGLTSANCCIVCEAKVIEMRRFRCR